ncbi:MAG: hypothetical protein ACREAY_02270 [Nitrososphaera sp.]|uniref:hypothetical protein n=1 Tax=Nitrososphaera sp. TaxID=1971748 RepID=UPI003D6E89A2
MTESAWIAHGVTNEEFEKYENEVERFVATLQTMIAKLHDEGHLDNAALVQFGKVLKDRPSP